MVLRPSSLLNHLSGRFGRLAALVSAKNRADHTKRTTKVSAKFRVMIQSLSVSFLVIERRRYGFLARINSNAQAADLSSSLGREGWL